MKFGDRVKETATTTGTGDFTLDGAVSQFSAFSARYSIGDRVPYAIVGQTGTEWEVGNGTLTGSSTLARTEVKASSNSDAAVNFSSGTKDVFVTFAGFYASELDTKGQIVAALYGAQMP